MTEEKTGDEQSTEEVREDNPFVEFESDEFDVTPASDEEVQGEQDKFKGKSKEDVQKSYDELQSKLGVQGKQIGELQLEVEAYKRMYNTQATQPQPYDPGQGQQPQADTLEDDGFDDKFVKSPSKAIREIVNEEMGRTREGDQASRVIEMAPLAKAEAKRKWPHLFEQIPERDLEQALYGGIKNKVVSPNVIAHPGGWAMAAWQALGLKNNFKIDPGKPEIKSEMPPGGERPSPKQAAPEKDMKPVRFDTETRKILDYFGDTIKDEKEAARLVREEEGRKGVG